MSDYYDFLLDTLNGEKAAIAESDFKQEYVDGTVNNVIRQLKYAYGEAIDEACEKAIWKDAKEIVDSWGFPIYEE